MAISATSSIVVAGVVSVAGQYAENRKIEVKTFVGIGVLALFISTIGEANTQFTDKFALLILVAALMYYGPKIAKSLGYTKLG